MDGTSKDAASDGYMARRLISRGAVCHSSSRLRHAFFYEEVPYWQ